MSGSIEVVGFPFLALYIMGRSVCIAIIVRERCLAVRRSNLTT